MIWIKTKEWFDKVNRNTYFSADAFLNNDLILRLPFQYGYNGARQAVENILARHFNSCAERWEVRDLLRKNGIEISELFPMIKPLDNYNEAYLRTKREKMGHHLPQE